MGTLFGSALAEHLPWREWKRRLALLLTVTLTANLGMISPKAAVTENSSSLVIWEIEELPEAVRKQQVTLGTKEEELELPDTLNVRVETDSDIQIASSSNMLLEMVMEEWYEVSVDWVFDSADNGELMYNENEAGVYTFEAELKDKGYSTEFVTLPVVTVEVLEDEVVEEWFFDIELPSTQTSAPALMTMSLENGQIDLASGNPVNWIDRVILPDYARDFYDVLVEGSDNDGNEDVLIADRYFSESNAYSLNSSKGTSKFNAIIACEYLNLDHQISDDEVTYASKAIRAALDAFDRDHPEVFWLNGSSWLKIGGKRTASGRYDYQVYFVTHVYEDPNSQMRNFDIRDDQYLSEGNIKSDIVELNSNVNNILGTVTGTNSAEQIIQINDWLTKHNEYNSSVANGEDNLAPKSAWECTSALDGRIGTSGPVCEAYARALKVLCDRLEIPCVLVDGGAASSSDDQPGPHMWNYVFLDDEDKWYAVDVTWNDPGWGFGKAESGYETERWLFLGADTIVAEEPDNWTFIQSHPAENLVSERGVQFTNGPELSSESYKRRPALQITFQPAEQTVVYTGEPAQIIAPEIRIEGVEGSAGIIDVTPEYSYRLQSDPDSEYISGIPADAGVYVVKASIPSTSDYMSGVGYLTLIIQKSQPVLTINSTYVTSKIYDAAPFAEPGKDFLTVTGTTFDSVKFAWYKGNSKLAAAPTDAGTYVLHTYVDETDNTYDASKDVNVVIEKRPVTVTADNKSKTYGSQDPQLTYTVDSTTPLPTGDALTGVLVREQGEDVKAGGYAINQGTLTDSTNPNYLITFKPGIFTIEKAVLIPVAEAQSIAQQQIALKPVSLTSASGAVGTVQYGISETNSKDNIRWQTSPVFSGLEPGTTYYFFVKIEGNSNYADGISEAALLTTLKMRLAKPVLKAGKTYVYTGETISVELDGVDETLMNVGGSQTGINAGDYTVTVSLKNPAKYAWAEEGETENSSPISINWQIQKADQAAVTIEAVSAKTYGDPAFKLTAAGGTGDGEIVFSVPENSKVLSISGDQASIIGAGTVRVSAVRQGDANHKDSAAASVEVNVAKKAVTVKAADKTKFVGKDNPELTIETPEAGVLVGNDGIDALGVTLSTTAEKDSEVGSYPITGTAVSDNYEVTVLGGTLTIAPTPDYKTERQEGITEVPEALRNNPALNTPEKIEEAMKQSVQDHLTGISANNVVVYDVTLMYSPDNGVTWLKATEEAFPDEGITVTLPYPSGTSSARYDFVVAHMFTTGDHAGEIEVPEIQATSEGIQFKVYSLSPIALGYKVKRGSSSGGSSGGGSGSGGSSGGGSTSGGPNGSSAGAWVSDSGKWWYRYTNGSYPAGTTSAGQEYISWVKINNAWWAFGADGYAKNGWVLDARTGLWYYIDINSGMRVGWYQDTDGRWYYLDPANGNMLVGWLQIGGVWYYLNPASGAGRPFGSMYSNETTPDGYFVNASGGRTGQ